MLSFKIIITSRIGRHLEYTLLGVVMLPPIFPLLPLTYLAEGNTLFSVSFVTFLIKKSLSLVKVCKKVCESLFVNEIH